MILLLSDDRNKANLLKCVKEHKILSKKLYSTQVLPMRYNLENFVKTSLQKQINLGLEYIIFDLATIENSIEDIVEIVNQIQYVNDEIKVMFITSFLNNQEEVEEYLKNNGYSFILNKENREDFDLQVTEILVSCLSDDELRKLSKIKWDSKGVEVAVYGVFERVGTTTTTFNMAQVLNKLGAKVCVVDESKTNWNVYCDFIGQKIVSEGIYNIHGIEVYSDLSLINKDKYNFIIYDTKNIDRLNNSHIKLVCTDLGFQCIEQNVIFMKKEYNDKNEDEYNIISLSIDNENVEFYKEYYKQLYVQDKIITLDEDEINEDYFMELVKGCYRI